MSDDYPTHAACGPDPYHVLTFLYRGVRAYVRYRLSLLPSSVTNPRLHLYQTPIPLPHPNDRNGSADAKSKSLDELKSENDRKVIVPDLPAAHFHWVHDGLVVRTAGRKGVLCKVERYRWKKREMQWGVQTISVTEQSESEIPDGPM